MSVQPVPADGAGGYGGEGAGAGVVVSTAASDGRSMRVGIPCGSGLELSSKRREDGTAAAGFAGVWCDDEQRSPVQEAARVAVRVVAAAAAVGGVTEKVAELRLEGAL